MNWKVHNPREPEPPEEPEGWLDSLIVWWYETALPAIRRFFGGGDDGPQGPRIA